MTALDQSRMYPVVTGLAAQGLDYDELFAAHERVRWSPARDLPPLGQAQLNLLDPEMLDGLVVLSRTEFSSVPAMLDLLRVSRMTPT